MPALANFNTAIDFHQTKHVSTMTALKLLFTYPWKLDTKNATEERTLFSARFSYLREYTASHRTPSIEYLAYIFSVLRKVKVITHI